MSRDDWARKQLDDTCAALASCGSGGRANELFKAATWLGKLVGARRLAESDARAGLFAACESNGLVREGRPAVETTITRGLEAGKTEPLEERTTPTTKAGRLGERSDVPRSEIAMVWAAGHRFETDEPVAKWALSRRIDPAIVDRDDLARAVSAAALLPPCAFAKDGKHWPRKGWRVVVPLYDLGGELGQVIYRCHGNPPRNQKKSMAGPGPRKGLVMACPVARGVLEHGWSEGANRVLVVAEGETDFLKCVSSYGARADRPGVLGVVSGSITGELAARIPTHTRVIIATDDDKAGDDYAAKLVDLCAPRARAGELTLERYRPSKPGEYTRGGGADLGDVLEVVERGNEPVDLSKTTERTLWRDLLTRTDKGVVHGSLANATTVLVNDEAWAGVLGYDERGGTITLLREPPLPRDVVFTSSPTPRAICDADLTAIAVWLSRAYEINVQAGAVHSALGLAARKNPFDHVRTYLEGVTWDGEARLDTALVRHLGGDDTPFARAAVRKWMISAVARAFEPGCKADHALVLEGAQGIGKSSFFRTLAPRDEFFLDDLKDVADKTETGRQIGRAWLVEFAELNALSRAEAGQIKAFLSKQIDDVRKPYAITFESCPRRCVFAGTTNESRYLDDPTGNRRFWPVRCSRKLDVAELERERDHLWAEAVAAYRAGEAWYLPTDLEAHARDEQSGRLRGDPWEERIASFLETRTASVTTAYLLDVVLDLRAQDQDRSKEMRVAAVLRSLGWERKRTMTNGKRAYAFVPPEPALPGIDGGAHGGSVESLGAKAGNPTYLTCPTSTERHTGEEVTTSTSYGEFPERWGSRAGGADRAQPALNYAQLDPEWEASR